MKTLKRIVSVVLAFLMLFSSVSILSSAVVGDGNENSFTLTTKFYREDPDTGDWIETTKVAKGEDVLARIFLKTDYYASDHTLFWLYPSDFMTFKTSNYKKSSGLYVTRNGKIPFENYDDDDSMANLYYWEGVSVAYATEPGGFATGDFADLLVSEGYMSATDFENKAWLALQMDMLDADIGAVEASDEYYLYQIMFTVNDDATGVGTLQTPEAAILTPDRPKAALNIKKYPDSSDITFGYTMRQFQADWTLDQDAYVTTQSTFTFNVDGTETLLSADIGSVYGDTITVEDPAIGKVFVGWDDASTEAIENYSSADIEAMEVGYEDMAFNAIFEAAEATYGVKVVEQKPDGSWPTDGEIAAIEAKSFDSKLNEVISAADYAEVPAGFSISNPTDTITVDDTDDDILIVKLARNEVTVTFDGVAVTGLYGSTQTAPKKTTDAGYTNEGWYTADGDKIADDAGEFTMPATAAAYVSNIVADKQDVTVNVTYFDAFQDKLVTVPVTFEDATVTGNKVEISSYDAGAEGTDYILLSDIASKVNLEHYQYDASSDSNNLKGTAGADGLTLTVGYAPKSYAVMFDVEGTKTRVNATYGSTIAASKLPATEDVKLGYTFEGWYLDVNDEATEFVPGETKVSGAATYYAKFTANQVKVNYVFAGEEGHGVANPYPDGKSAIYDDVVELPAITAPAGWEFKWTVSDTAINYGNEYRVGTQDVTVTGTWTRKTYTITYYYDDNKVATVFDQPTELKFGDPIPNNLTASQAGKVFNDWDYEKEDGTIYDNADGMMPAHNLHAVANTSDIQYTVQLMKYDDIIGEEEDAYPLDTSVPATYMKQINIDVDTEEEGYIFTGWKFADGTPVSFPFEVVFQDEESGAYISVPEDGNWTLLGTAATAQVYATYTPMEINVTFDPDGGYFDNNPASTDAKVVITKFGEEILKPENNWNIQRDGYTFMQWDPDFYEGDTVQSIEPDFNTYTAMWLPNVEYVFAGNVPAGATLPAKLEGVDFDALITLPAFDVDGYLYDVTIESEDVFDNEDGTFNMGTTPVTVTYTWRADDHVAYKINTYLANVGTAEYTFKETLTRYGTTGDTIVISDADKALYTGFEFSEVEPADKAITGDGLAEVNVYYNRKMVDVVVKDGKGETIIDTEVQYGATLTQPATTPDAVNPGEEFDKWIDEDGNAIDWSKPVDSEAPIVIVPSYKKTEYTVTYATAGDVPAGYELPNAEYKNITNAHYGDSVKVPAWNNDTVPGYNVAYTVTGANGTEGAYTVGEGNVTVTAVWSKDIFKVTYVTNGTAPAGYELPADVANATIGTAVQIPTWVAQGAPAGYTLGFEVTGAKTNVDGSYEVYNSDVTVTATWNYVNYTVDYVTVGDAPAGYELPEDIANAIIGTEFTVPAWNNDTVPGYNVTINVENAVLTNGVYSVGTNNVTVTATWTYKNFTIDYVTVGEAPAGYDLPADVENAIINTEVAIPDWAKEAAPAGYTMKLDVVGAVDGKVYDKDVTVTVTWEYVPYTVTYSYDATAPEGAVVPGVENVHVGQTITLATPAAVNGYAFNDWTVTGATKNDDGTYTVGAGNVTAVGSWTALSTTYNVQRWFEIVGQDGQYAAEDSVITLPGTAGDLATYSQDVKGFNLVKVDPADATIKGDGTTTINAYYDRKDVTVTYLNEAGEVASTGTVQFGGQIQKPEDATSADSGMKFNGWAYEDNTPVATWPINVTEETAITLKPTFTEKTFTVYFMTDAENAYAYDTFAYKTSIAKPSGEPVKTGYKFVEWRKGSVDGAAWAETDTVPASDVYYYAYFEPKTVSYEIYKYFQEVGSTSWDDATMDFETKTATTGEKITLDLDAYEVPGFTIDTVLSTFKDVEIKGDGSTDFILYYTRNNVTVTVDGIAVTLPVGDKITKSDIEEIIKDTKDEGYNYTEWKDENGDVVKFPYEVPVNGGTLTPTLVAKDFTLTFVDKDNNVVDTKVVPYKSTIVPPAYPEYEGYKPTGWFNVADNTAMPETVPAENATYKVAYTNSTNTEYAITIYMMDLAGEYTIKTTTAAYGTTGDEVRIVPQSFTGLYEDTTHPDRNLTDTIAANGSTELRIYYARAQYTVTYDDGEATKVYYGAALPKAEDPEKVGQKFTGWTDADGKAPSDYAGMPDKNLVFTSNWDDVYYTITYVVNGVQTPVKYKYGETVAQPETPNEPGMTFTGWLPEVPATMGDKDLIIVAQFGTAYYTVTYLDDVDGNVFAEYTVMFGQEVPVPTEEPTKAFHKFVEWLNVPATMEAENITIVPKFERVAVKLVPQDGSTTKIDTKEMIIYGLATRLSETILRNQFLKVEGDGYMVIKEAYGVAGFYGTGAKVELYDNADPSGQPIEVYTIIVFGDLNGDARINATDDSIICQEIAATNFDEIWSYDILPGYDKYRVMAADLNQDGLINATDRATISNITLGSEMVNQETREIIRADA